jgi:hypothetical protein
LRLANRKRPYGSPKQLTLTVGALGAFRIFLHNTFAARSVRLS